MPILIFLLVCGGIFCALCMFVAGYQYHRIGNLSYVEKARVFNETFRKLAKKSPLDSLDVDVSSDNASVSSRVAALTKSEFLCRTEFSLRPGDVKGIKNLARHIFAKHLLDIYAQCRLRDTFQSDTRKVLGQHPDKATGKKVDFNMAAAKIVDYISGRRF